MNSREVEDKFANSGRVNRKRGVQVWSLPLMMQEGGAYVTPCDASDIVSISTFGVLSDDAREQIKVAAAKAAEQHAPKYVATVKVRRLSETHAPHVTTCGYGNAAESALLQAAEKAVVVTSQRAAEAAEYLRCRQDDRKRAEELLAAVRAVFSGAPETV